MDLTIRGQVQSPLLDRNPRLPLNGHGQHGGDPCGAARAQNLIGVDANALHFPGIVRIIAPGTIVTHDYRPERMNVRTDGSGQITRIYCG